MEVSILGVSWPPCPFPVSVQQEAGVVKMTERLSLFSSTEDHSLCQLGHLLKAVSSFIPKDDSLKTQIGPLGNGDDLRKVDIPVSRWKWIVKKRGGGLYFNYIWRATNISWKSFKGAYYVHINRFHDFERFSIYRPMLRVPLQVQRESSEAVDRWLTRVHAAHCISVCGLVQTEAPTLNP